jgi:flagellar FliL protein
MAGKTEEAEAKTGDDEEKAKGGGGKKKLLLIVGPVLLLVIAAAVYFLFFKPSGTAEPKKVVHVPGEVVTLDPITINLAGGHFLKLGMALQSDAGAAGGHGKLTGAQALDAAIELFSGKTVTELSTKEGREKAKEKLVEDVTERYHEVVYDIYFTEFVYQ